MKPTLKQTPPTEFIMKPREEHRKKLQSVPENSTPEVKIDSGRNNAKAKRTDLIKKTIQGAREMFASMHSPRAEPPDGRIHKTPRVEFNVSFQEVDFSIDPNLIGICRELSAKLKESSDSISTPACFLSAMSCVSFQENPSPTISSNETVTQKSTPLAVGEQDASLQPSQTSESLGKRTFIVFPTDLDQSDNPDSSGDLTGSRKPSSKTVVILHSDNTNFELSADEKSEIPNTTFIIIQSDGVNRYQGEASNPDGFNQNVTVKLVNVNDETRNESEPSQETKSKPIRIFTFDTLPKSNIALVSSQSSKRFVDSGYGAYDTETDRSASRNRDGADKRDSDVNLRDRTEESEEDGINTRTQDERTNNMGMNVTRLGTAAHPEYAAIGQDFGGDTPRFETVTVDPLFSSITKFDMAGSLQITQRTVRGRSRPLRSPEKKFGIYEYPLETDVEERPHHTSQSHSKYKKRFEPRGKSLSFVVEQSNSTLSQPYESSHSRRYESDEDLKTEQGAENIREIVNEVSNKTSTIDVPSKEETMVPSPTYMKVNKSDEISRMASEFNKLCATVTQELGNSSSDTDEATRSNTAHFSQSSATEIANGQTSQKERYHKTQLTASVNPSKATCYSQLKDRVDELKRRVSSNRSRICAETVHSVQFKNTRNCSVCTSDSKKNEIKEKIKKRRASVAAKAKQKEGVKKAATFDVQNVRLPKNHSFVIMTKRSCLLMRRTNRRESLEDRTNRSAKMKKYKQENIPGQNGRSKSSRLY